MVFRVLEKGYRSVEVESILSSLGKRPISYDVDCSRLFIAYDVGSRTYRELRAGKDMALAWSSYKVIFFSSVLFRLAERKGQSCNRHQLEQTRTFKPAKKGGVGRSGIQDESCRSEESRKDVVVSVRAAYS